MQIRLPGESLAEGGGWRVSLGEADQDTYPGLRLLKQTKHLKARRLWLARTDQQSV